MTRISPSRTSPPTHYDEAAITHSSPGKFRWHIAMVYLLRLAASICLWRGLTYWGELLSLFEIDFIDRIILQQIAVVCFANFYCFAAVGLWMVASWGAALWILSLVGEGVLLILEPKMHVHFDPLNIGLKLGSAVYLIIGIVGVVTYIIMTWLVDRENERESRKI